MDSLVLASVTHATSDPSLGWGPAIVMGIVQGLTEFLPISSSAHVLIISRLLGWSDPGAAFTAVTQIGTELAVIVYFARDLWRVLKAWLASFVRSSARRDPDARLGWVIVIGTIPIAVLGLLFSGIIETAARNLWLVSTMLIVFGVVLGVADRYGAKMRDVRSITLRSGLALGFGQALALIPGVSRSGGTITTGLFLGYTREAATRVAFLLAVPAVLASGLYEATKIHRQSAVAWGPTILATVVAFAVGLAVIAWLLRWVSTRSYLPFVVYRVIVGSAMLVLLATGVVAA